MRNQVLINCLIGLSAVYAVHFEISLDFIHDRLNEQKEFLDATL